MLLEKGRQTAQGHIVEKQRSEDCLGYTAGRLFDHFRVAAFTERPLQEQRNWLVTFPIPIPQHKHRATLGNQHSTNSRYLTSYTKPLLPQSGGNTLPSQTCLSPRASGPLPQKTSPNPCQYHISQPRGLWSLSSGMAAPGLISQADQNTSSQCKFRPGTKHCPPQAKRASADDWPEG